MNSFDELCTKISQDIDAKEIRSRSRTEQEQIRFNYAVRHQLIELWKKHHTHKDNQSSIQKNKNFYSALQQYRDPYLTYRMAIQTFEGLQKLDLIEVTKNGFYDHVKMEGNLTRYKATPKLNEMLNELDGHPLINLPPNLDSNTILLRQKIDGRRMLAPYDEDKDTEQWRINLREINGCFSRHILDLRIKDSEVESLQERLLSDSEKEPIDLTNKVLVRIFINNSFGEGGRFYRGWWQNVPSEYRPFITIESKHTQELDYSQLNPNMIYSLYNHELGSEDAYSRVLGEEHRDVVKEAFNAMFQSNTSLESKPKDINLDNIEMTWKELKQAILNAHKPIKDLFFTGLGNKLQFEDSIMAENVMLQFARMDYPALPIHDSFIMHHAFGNDGSKEESELEEAMRRAFHDRFHRDIGISRELIKRPETKDKNNTHPEITEDLEDLEELLDGESDYSLWHARDNMWMRKK
ncbi:hypothetical protein N9O69_05090 [Alphaproteobacteria bacterium]|nr:hypothetical protein [Alphaproteobacteria bacterium]